MNQLQINVTLTFYLFTCNGVQGNVTDIIQITIPPLSFTFKSPFLNLSQGANHKLRHTNLMIFTPPPLVTGGHIYETPT